MHVISPLRVDKIKDKDSERYALQSSGCQGLGVWKMLEVIYGQLIPQGVTPKSLQMTESNR